MDRRAAPSALGASLVRSQKRLDSARRVLTRAAAQLCQADATIRRDAVNCPDTAVLSEQTDRQGVALRESCADHARVLGHRITGLHARATKEGLHTSSATTPLAQLAVDMLAACDALMHELTVTRLEYESLLGKAHARART